MLLAILIVNEGSSLTIVNEGLSITIVNETTKFFKTNVFENDRFQKKMKTIHPYLYQGS